MKLFLLTCVSQALLCTFVFGQPEMNDDDQQSSDSYYLIVPALDKFTETFFSHLATAHPNENLFFSSVSISLAFSLVLLGARSNTSLQIVEGLGFYQPEDPEGIYKAFHQLLKNLNQSNHDLELNIVEALFVDKRLNLLQTFEENAKKFFQSEVISTDFSQMEAVDQINSYVEEKTNGTIRELLSQLDEDTVLVLINTMFFKGSWKDRFEVGNTIVEDFHVDENTVVQVPMMYRNGEYHVLFNVNLGCTVVKIPYKGNVSTILIIPHEGRMKDVEREFPASLRKWMKALSPTKIILSIPKFSVSATLDLKEEFIQMGITDVFSDSADLSGISNDGKLKVSKAVHEAVINVTEEGTVAAAATTEVLLLSAATYPEVKADRPFFLSIVKDDDYTALFTGRIINPTQ